MTTTPLMEALELFRTTRDSLEAITEKTGVSLLELEAAVAGRRRNGLHEAAVSVTHETFGRMVRDARMLNLGLSLAQASQVVGIRKSKLLKIEQGNEDLSLSTMTRLATIMGISIEFNVKEAHVDRHGTGPEDKTLLENGDNAPQPGNSGG